MCIFFLCVSFCDFVECFFICPILHAKYDTFMVCRFFCRCFYCLCFCAVGESDWCEKKRQGAVPSSLLRLSVFVPREGHEELFLCTNRCLCRRGVIGHSSSFYGLNSWNQKCFRKLFAGFLLYLQMDCDPTLWMLSYDLRIFFFRFVSLSLEFFPLSSSFCEASVCALESRWKALLWVWASWI